MELTNNYSFNKANYWLMIHLDPIAVVTAVEEHTHTTSRQINPQANESQEELFVRLAITNGFSLYEIEAFLQDCKDRTLRRNTIKT